MEIIARAYDTGSLIRLRISGERIAAVQPFREEDLRGEPPWISPGFIDIQVNGHGGREFSSPTLNAEGVALIIESLNPFGVTKFCPTVTTQGFETLAHAMTTIAAACDGSPTIARRIAGIHLEGPYISREDGPRGAHPAAYCRPPDWDEFRRLQDAASGRIRIITISPEFDGACPFVGKAAAAGVIVALGHTAANSNQIRAAVDAGARLSTHLGNGAHRLLPRHPNYLWDQLAEDRLMASLIADGHHLPAEVVKTIVRAKGLDRCILISDLAGLAGLPPGPYHSELCDTEILPDGRLVIAGQRQLLAGAARPIGTGIGNAMRFAGLELHEAIALATTNPARLLGLAAGGLVAGESADLTLFDLSGELTVRACVVGGTLVFGHV